ncbi:hypothetical protein QTV49_004310 [Vibrio vulnificus]|nr:hypothetical protein [Vibrio vulnificus]
MISKITLKVLSSALTSLNVKFSLTSLYALAEAVEKNDHSLVKQLLIDFGTEKVRFDDSLFFRMYDSYRPDGTHEGDWVSPRNLCSYLTTSSELKEQICLSDGVTMARLSHYVFYRGEYLPDSLQNSLAKFVYVYGCKIYFVGFIGLRSSDKGKLNFALAKDIFMLSVQDGSALSIGTIGHLVERLSEANPNPQNGILSKDDYNAVLKFPYFFEMLMMCTQLGCIKPFLSLLLGNGYSVNRILPIIKNGLSYTPEVLEISALLEYAGLKEVSPIHTKHLTRCFNLSSCVLTTIGTAKTLLKDEILKLELRHPESGSYALARLILNLIDMHLHRGVSKDEISEEIKSIIKLPFVSEMFFESVLLAHFNSTVSNEALNFVLEQIPEKIKGKNYHE